MKKTIGQIGLIVALTTMLTTFNLKAQDQPTPSKVREVGLVFSNLNSFGLRFKCGNEKTLFRITSLVLNGTNTTNNYSNYSFMGNEGNIPTSPANTLGAGLNLGIEKRKMINDKFYFFYGLEWINSYSENKSNTTTPANVYITTTVNNVFTTLSTVVNNSNNTHAYTVSSGLGIIAGAAFRINNSFSIAAELIPSVSYKYTKTTSSIITYNVVWLGSSTTGYTPSPYMTNNTNQTTINKGFNYGLSNAAASITIAYKIK